MIRSLPIAAAGLVAATLSFGGISANAQSPPATPPAAGPAPSGGPSGGPSMVQPAEGIPWPVLVVTSVEVLRSQRAGGMDIVRARGLTTSSAWGAPHLLPITRGNPIDGTLDLILQGVAPAAPGPMGPFMPIEAILPVEVGHPYKAVRVRSGTNAITLKTLPGYAEVAGPKDDFSKIVGKYFLAKGATAPAGVAPGDVVREADMTWPVRVIRPSDGIPSYRLEPNRLTVVLAEDGRIADAAWD
jgi:hypothetical protein